MNLSFTPIVLVNLTCPKVRKSIRQNCPPMCRKFITHFGVLTFFLWYKGSLNESSGWHGSFPWIYSNKDKEWSYWKTGKDGRFYKWSQSSGGWQIYNDGEGQWTRLMAADLNETKWEPGREIQNLWWSLHLEKIKDAVLNSQSYLDLSYQRIHDLTPGRSLVTTPALFAGKSNF